MIIFLVSGESILHPDMETQYVIVSARNREFAKSKASKYLGTDTDKYTVTPLTPTGSTVYLDMTIKN